MDQKTSIIFYPLAWKTDNSKTQKPLSSKCLMNVNECSESQRRAWAHWLCSHIMCQRCWMFYYTMGLNASKKKHSPCMKNYWEMDKNPPKPLEWSELAAPHWYLTAVDFRLDSQAVWACLGCFSASDHFTHVWNSNHTEQTPRSCFQSARKASCDPRE